MTKDEFVDRLQTLVKDFNKVVATKDGDWIVKGFIDVYKKIYAITLDTKVVSKVLELLLIPAFQEFADKNDLTLELSPQQNFYPDLTFTSKTSGEKFAVDIKSTFRTGANRINAMTLGAYTGYFRERTSTKNTLYPYGAYSAHVVMGVIYTQVKVNPNEKTVFDLSEIEAIQSVIREFTFFVQHKYRIASAVPGSGNTKNIGSITNIKKILEGAGIFASLGEEVYDDYWMYYLSKDMALKAGVPQPYTNLRTYLAYKEKGIKALEANKEKILQLFEEEEAEGKEEDTTEIQENNGNEQESNSTTNQESGN